MVPMMSVRLATLFSEHRTVVLYFFIGSSAAVVDYGVFLALFNIADIQSVHATVVSIGVATIYGFLLNAKYNFKINDKIFFRFISYSVVSGIGMLFSVAFLYVFNVRMGFDGNIMKLLSLPFIFVIQYTLNKAVSFRKSN
jgi:putative flippase GtrA